GQRLKRPLLYQLSYGHRKDNSVDNGSTVVALTHKGGVLWHLYIRNNLESTIYLYVMTVRDLPEV
ncbi:uncharacterized protein METZ01_LOCUS493112, partial [marine metagenome]